MDELYNISVNNKRLCIVYNKSIGGLFRNYSSDKLMYNYIRTHTKEALQLAIHKESDELYVLNIASTQDFGFIEWKYSQDILHRQLDIFMPIIQMFMEYALTNKYNSDN